MDAQQPDKESTKAEVLNSSQRQAHNELMRLATRIQFDAEESRRESDKASLRSSLDEAQSQALGLYEIPDEFRLSVVMPVYNERDTVGRVIERVFDTWLPIELTVVNDGSDDGTEEKLQQITGDLNPRDWNPNSSLHVHNQPFNQGKGAALRTGFEKISGDVAVIQDADMEYDPLDFYTLLRPIMSGQANVVYGSRFRSNSESDSPGWHRFGNQLITRISNWRTRQRFTDVETCYKMMRRELLTRIVPSLRETRFGIELELTAKLAKLPETRFQELPITYQKRGYADGKKIGWRDAIRALWCIMRY